MTRILVYCGEDGDAGRALAETLRKEDEQNKIQLCSVEFFSPEDDVQRVIIMPDVPEWRADTIREAYPGKVVAKNPIVVAVAGDQLPRYFNVTHIEAPPKKRGWPKGKPRKVAV